mmetsp:Transcript_50280/g.121772  ORF Transcript_50280/g.121772 Transcript_50280/m.121772 type:complete len:145 (+) Transcript_50280:96-530(+)
MDSILPTITKIASSGVILPGIGMTLMGLGVIDTDPKLAGVATVFTSPLNLPLEPFLVLVGSVKVWAVLRLWFDKVPPSSKLGKNLAWIGLASPAAAAVYGHHQTEGIGSTIAPTIYLCVLATCHYFETKKETEGQEAAKTTKED